MGVHESVEGEHTCKHKTDGQASRFTLSLRQRSTRLPAQHHLVFQSGLAALTTRHSRSQAQLAPATPAAAPLAACAVAASAASATRKDQQWDA